MNLVFYFCSWETWMFFSRNTWMCYDREPTGDWLDIILNEKKQSPEKTRGKTAKAQLCHFSVKELRVGPVQSMRASSSQWLIDLLDGALCFPLSMIEFQLWFETRGNTMVQTKIDPMKMIDAAVTHWWESEVRFILADINRIERLGRLPKVPFDVLKHGRMGVLIQFRRAGVPLEPLMSLPFCNHSLISSLLILLMIYRWYASSECRKTVIKSFLCDGLDWLYDLLNNEWKKRFAAQVSSKVFHVYDTKKNLAIKLTVRRERKWLHRCYSEHKR